MNSAVADASSADQAEVFRRLIRTNGPISLSQFMGESNARYYSSRDPLASVGDASSGGSDGDFITAPEVSQMFGELIGLWLADVWDRVGRPERCHYVELGPGRGTLASDALRAAGQHGLKPQVHFVEGSQALREIQQAAVRGATHHHDLTTVPDDAPILLVANEFFDALPIRQLIRTEAGWRERMVGLDGEAFVFVAGDKPMDAAVPDHLRSAEVGTVVESNPASAAVASEIADRLVAQTGAALIVDYGSKKLCAGSTLQALKDHQKVDVFASPGEADMTAHVDFETLGQVAQRQGARVMGVEAQGAWLTAMGIDARSAALARSGPDQVDVIQRQYNRLVAEDQMGGLFKVMGLGSPQWPQGAGFSA